MSQRILIIRNDHIGDLILSTAVFREIKKKIHNCKISLIASKINRSVIEKNKNIDEILELETPRYNLKSISSYIKMAKKIKKRNFDIGIDLRGSLMNSFFLLWLGGVKKRIGLADSNNNQFISKITSIFFTDPVKLDFFNSKEHISKGNLKIINKGLKLNAKDYRPEIITDEQDKKDVEKFIKKNKLKRYICICPIAGLEKKQWGLDNWEKLIKKLGKEKVRILLLGTKEYEKILEKLGGGVKNCQIVLDFNLRKMAILFKKSSLVIAQDGGPMHIAWAIGANLIELLRKFQDRLDQCVPLKNAVIFSVRKEDNMNLIKIEDVLRESKKILKNEVAYTPCKENNYSADNK